MIYVPQLGRYLVTGYLDPSAQGLRTASQPEQSQDIQEDIARKKIDSATLNTATLNLFLGMSRVGVLDLWQRTDLTKHV